MSDLSPGCFEDLVTLLLMTYDFVSMATECNIYLDLEYSQYVEISLAHMQLL